MDIINYLGIGGILFVAFIVFCMVKGGNNKGDGGNKGGNSNSNNSTGGVTSGS